MKKPADWDLLEFDSCTTWADYETGLRIIRAEYASFAKLELLKNHVVTFGGTARIAPYALRVPSDTSSKIHQEIAEIVQYLGYLATDHVSPVGSRRPLHLAHIGPDSHIYGLM